MTTNTFVAVYNQIFGIGITTVTILPDKEQKESQTLDITVLKQDIILHV